MVTESALLPPPGLHRNVPMETYRAWPALNVSKLKAGRRSMAHLQAALSDQDDEGTAAKDFGTAGHMALLEPERFGLTRLVGGPINPSTKKCYGRDTKKWEEYAKANPGRILLSEEEHDDICALQKSVERHRLAHKMLMAAGPCEAALLWEDSETGIMCKARLDKLIPGKVAADLKTTDNASDKAFSHAVWKYGYYLQVPWYMDGIKAVTGKTMELPLVAMEKAAPYAVAVYTLDRDTIEQGRLENRSMLTQMAECQRTGVWAGYPETVQTIGLPKFARNNSVQAVELVGSGLDVDDTGHGF